MGRKRRLVATAREKVVAEEAATALEVEQKEAVLQGKPDEALFIVDAAGERNRRKAWRVLYSSNWIPLRVSVVGPLVSTTSRTLAQHEKIASTTSLYCLLPH